MKQSTYSILDDQEILINEKYFDDQNNLVRSVDFSMRPHEEKKFTYDDKNPWPTEPDGNGPSLVLISPESLPDHDDAENWRSSLEDGGAPGDSDGNPFTGGDIIDYAVAEQPTISLVPGENRVSYTLKAGADDAEVIPQWSTDLENWVTTNLALIEQKVEENGNITFTWSIPEGGVKGFVRLKVTER